MVAISDRLARGRATYSQRQFVQAGAANLEAAAIMSACTPAGPADPQTGTGTISARLEDLLQGLVAEKQIHHAILAVEKLDGSFRWIGAAGDVSPDGPPMQEDSRFFIASVTKLHIAAAILRLHERKLVDLAQPISTYLPSSLISGIHQFRGVDFTEQITLHHLLGHMSGLPDYLDEAPPGEQSLMDKLIESDRTYTIEEGMQIVRRLNPHFPPQPLDAARQRIRYSDTNYQLLIAVIGAVTAQPIHLAFKELLYVPLDLKHTFHFGTLDEPEPHPVTIWAGDHPLDIPLALSSFGDLISTADDLLRFMRGLICGELFDDPATLDMMMGHWNTFGFTLNFNAPQWPIQYGLGIMRFRIPRILSPLRAVPAVVGHTGISGSWLFYCPELELMFCGTVDQVTAGATPYSLAPKLLRIFE